MKTMRNWRTMVGGLAVVAAATVLLPGCGNRKPVITGLTMASQLEAGKSTVVTCTAEDPDGDTLSYEWNCSRGSFISDTGPSVKWKAPMASGTDTVTVKVTDGRGGEASGSVTTSVTPISYNLAAWGGPLPAHNFNAWWASIDANIFVHGSFSSDSSAIRFLMLDSIDFEKWYHSETYSSAIKLDHSFGDSFSLTVNSSRTYYFVLDNRDSNSVNTYGHIYVEGTTP
jgi:hypothetical protein